MLVGIVVGNVWATRKEDALNGLKLVIGAAAGPRPQQTGRKFGRRLRGRGHRPKKVLITTGSSARKALLMKRLPWTPPL